MLKSTSKQLGLYRLVAFVTLAIISFVVVDFERLKSLPIYLLLSITAGLTLLKEHAKLKEDSSYNGDGLRQIGIVLILIGVLFTVGMLFWL